MPSATNWRCLLYRQFSQSITGFGGTACGKGMYMAGRWPRPRSNSEGTFSGHFCQHVPQPVHLA